MEINDFARMNHERSVKHNKDGVFDWEYCAIALGGETGELLNIVKKIRRGDFPMDRKKISDEVADAITYAFLILTYLGVDAEKAIMDKYEEVNKRLEKGGFGKRA